MNIQFVLPKWSITMPWVSNIQKVFGAGTEFVPIPDLSKNPEAIVFMWCNSDTAKYINSSNHNIPMIVFMRRYEFFSGEWGQIDWHKVKHLIFVNDVFRIEFEEVFPEKPVKTSVIYNSVDTDKWTYKEHKHGKKIAMVGYVNQRKNLPLATQILSALPEGYELHIIGGIQCPETFMYMVNQASRTKRVIQSYGHVNSTVANTILDDMDYILCTSISEGNPNNVNEGMAKGLKPLVHTWPGAGWQYPPELTFSTVKEALALIDPTSPYDSMQYKQLVEDKFSFKNVEALKTIVQDAVGNK